MYKYVLYLILLSFNSLAELASCISVSKLLRDFKILEVEDPDEIKISESLIFKSFEFRPFAL